MQFIYSLYMLYFCCFSKSTMHTKPVFLTQWLTLFSVFDLSHACFGPLAIPSSAVACNQINHFSVLCRQRLHSNKHIRDCEAIVADRGKRMLHVRPGILALGLSLQCCVRICTSDLLLCKYESPSIKLSKKL